MHRDICIDHRARDDEESRIFLIIFYFLILVSIFTAEVHFSFMVDVNYF